MEPIVVRRSKTRRLVRRTNAVTPCGPWAPTTSQISKSARHTKMASGPPSRFVLPGTPKVRESPMKGFFSWLSKAFMQPPTPI